MLSGKEIDCQSVVLNSKPPNYHNIPHDIPIKTIPIYTLCKMLYIVLVTTKTQNIIMVWITSTVGYLNTHYSKIHSCNKNKANTKQLKKEETPS